MTTTEKIFLVLIIKLIAFNYKNYRVPKIRISEKLLDNIIIGRLIIKKVTLSTKSASNYGITKHVHVYAQVSRRHVQITPKKTKSRTLSTIVLRYK